MYRRKKEYNEVHIEEENEINRTLLSWHNNTFIRNTFGGKILGERTRGHTRTSNCQDLKQLTDVTSYIHN